MFDFSSIDSIKSMITYGTLILFALIFLIGFIIGVIRGRYKVLKRFIYVMLFMIILAYFTPLIVNGLLNINIPFGINTSGRGFIENFITENEMINNLMIEMPSLQPIMFELIVAVLSPLLYVVFVWLGLVLLFPFYLLYLLIAKYVYKRPKYEMQFGEVVKNEKNKKVKVKYKKHRLFGGLIRGVQSIIVFSIILMPVNSIVRMYNQAKVTTGNASVSLCESMTFLGEQQQICDYMEMFNSTYIAKAGKINFLDKALFKRLSVMKVNRETYNLENEMLAFIKAAVHISNSGIIDMAMDENFDPETFDFSTLNSVEIEAAVDSLFLSKMFSNLIVEGTNFALKEYGEPEIKNFLGDATLVLNLSYDKDTFRSEVGVIVDIIKVIIDNNMISIINADFEDPISIKSKVSETSIKALIDKILEIKIGQKLIPHFLDKYLTDYGYTFPTEVVDWENEKSILKNAVSFLYTIDSLDPQELIDAMNKSQLMLLGASLGNVSRSALFSDVLPFMIDDLLSKNLSQFNFDTSALANLDWEVEFEGVADGVMNLKNSGLLNIIMQNNFDIKEIGPEDLDFALLKNSFADMLNTTFVSSLLVDAINYGVEQVKPSLEDLIGEDASTIDLSYNLESLKIEINSLVDVLQIIVENELLKVDFTGSNPVENITNQVSESVAHQLIDKLLNINVSKKVLPHMIFKFLEEYGATQLTDTEIELMDWSIETNIVKDAISLVYLIDMSALTNQDEIFEQLSDHNIEVLGNFLDGSKNSAMLGNMIPTALNKLLSTTLEDFVLDEQAVNDVTSWQTELMIIKDVYSFYNDFSNDVELNFTNLGLTLEDMKASNLMMSLVPDLFELAIPLLDETIVIPEDTNWDNEMDYIIEIVNNLDGLGALGDIGMTTLSNPVKRDAMGNILDAALASNIFSNLVSDKFLDLMNPMLEDFEIEILREDLDNVTSWSVELANLNSLMDEFMVETEGVYSFEVPEMDLETITSLLNKIEVIQLLEDKKVNILVTAIEMAGFMDETELAEFKLIDKTTVDYSNEKTIILSIFAHADLIDSLQNLDLVTMDVISLGDVINNIYGKPEGVDESVLLKGYLEDKVLGLMPAVVPLDEAKLEQVDDWQIELGYIKAVVNNPYDINNFAGFDISTATDTDINNVGTLLNDALSSFLVSDYVASEMINVLAAQDIDKDVNEIKAVSDWVEELELIKEMLEMDENSNVTDIENLFIKIENSDLLSSEKERILVEIANKIDPNIPLSTTLNAQEYIDEKAMLIKMFEFKDDLDTLIDPGFDFATADDTFISELGSLIDDAATSKLFEAKVTDNLREALLPDVVYTKTLGEVPSWGVELMLLKEALNAATSVSNSTELRDLLDAVGESVVLEESKWDILEKVITQLGIVYTIDESNYSWQEHVDGIVAIYEFMHPSRRVISV